MHPLSNEEYNGLPFSLESIIKNQVNKEENKWYKDETPPLPKYTPTEYDRRSAGWMNFVREIRI